MVAGPYGATLLGDFGADVVKVEPPGGEDSRWYGPKNDADSAPFVGINRNKRSVEIDLHSPDGTLALEELVRWADVVIDNLRPTAKARLGIDFESLQTINSRVISVNVSAFGNTGPYGGRPGIDPVIQAISGFMTVTGTNESGPLKAGPPVADAVASLLVAFGALTALWAREQTGQGQAVEVALVDGLIHIQATYAGQHFLLGEQQPRTGNSSEWYAPYDTYRCRDNTLVHIACYNDKFFGNLCLGMEKPKLVGDPRFSNNDARLANRDELDRIVGGFCSSQNRPDVLQRLQAADVIVSPVYDYSEALSDPQVLHNEMVVEVDHHAGPLKVTGVPVRLSDTPGRVRLPPPQLGAHNLEVFKELGLDSELISRLVRTTGPPAT